MGPRWESQRGALGGRPTSWEFTPVPYAAPTPPVAGTMKTGQLVVGLGRLLCAGDPTIKEEKLPKKLYLHPRDGDICNNSTVMCL